MTEIEIICTLDKMICDREEILRRGTSRAIREEVDALEALRTSYCSMLDLESEYMLLQKAYMQQEDEVNRLRGELDKLHAEPEEAKCYFEVLLSDSLPSVRIENGAYFQWTVQEKQLVVFNESDDVVAAFNDEHVVGIIKRGK